MKNKINIRFLYIAIALLLLALTSLLSMKTGMTNLSWQQIFNALLDSNNNQNLIISEFRLPRLLVALMSGAMFALSGTMLQALVRNSMAAPDVLGMNAGAGLTVLISLMAFPNLTLSQLVPMAIVGSFVTLIVTYCFANVKGVLEPARLLLVGVAIGAILKAIEQWVLLNSASDISQALSFLTGSVYGSDWNTVTRIFPWFILLTPLALMLSKYLDMLWISEEQALSIGCNVRLINKVVLVFAVLLSGSALMGSGALGFVGLVAPNVARYFTGVQHKYTLVLSMICGAILVALADAIGQRLLPPQEIPVGLITILIGAPYFLWLLKKNNKMI